MSSARQTQIPSSRRTIADALQHATRTSAGRQPVSDDVIGRATATEQIELAPFLRAQQPTRRWRMPVLSGRARVLILVLVAAIAAAPWVWAGIQPDPAPVKAESGPNITSPETPPVLQPSVTGRRVTSSQKAGKLVPGTGPVSKPAPHRKAPRRALPASKGPRVISAPARTPAAPPAHRAPSPDQHVAHQGGAPIELVPVM